MAGRSFVEKVKKLRLGAGEVFSGDGEGACHVHKPGCDFNDNNIAISAAYWTCLAERFLVDE